MTDDQKLNTSGLKKIIKSDDFEDPLVFLEAVANGYDPRKTSKIYDLVNEINDFAGGAPNPQEWAEVVEHVNKYHQKENVKLSESINASKILAEYLHAKRKHIETVDGNASVAAHNDPLTAEEIEIFREVFNDEF